MSFGDETARIDRDRPESAPPAAEDVRSETARLENLADLYIASDDHGQALLQYEAIERSNEWEQLAAGDKARICHKAARSHVALGSLDQALLQATKAEKLARLAEDHLLVGKIHAISGQIHRRIGNQQEALAHSLRALDLLRHTDENREIAFVQLTCGSIFLRQGNLSDAVRYFQDSLAAFRRVGDEEGIAKAYNNLGVAYKDLCQWENAVQALKKAMEIDRRFGNYAGVALRMLNLGLIQYQRGDWEGSRRRTEKSLQMARAVGDSMTVTLCSLALARIARRDGHWNEARGHALEALRLSRRRANRRELAASYEELGAWCASRGRPHSAEAFFRRALSIAEPIAEKSDHVAEICRRLSEVAAARGRPSEAASLAKRALRAAVKIGDTRLVGLGLRALAAAVYAEGNAKLGAFYIARSVRIFESRGIPFELARSLLESARIARENRDLGSARSELARAEAIFRRLGQGPESSRVLVEFARLKVLSGRFEDALVLLRKAERLDEEAGAAGGAGDIQALRSSVEERIASASLTESNRFLAFGESVRDRSGVLVRIARELSADRVFLFHLGEDDEPVIGECRGVSPAEARRLIEDLAPSRLGPGRIRPLLSIGGSGSPDPRARLLAPAASADAGVYADRSLAHSTRAFGRGDLDFLVGLAREIFGASPRLSSLPAFLAASPTGAGFEGVVTQSKGMLDILSMLRKLSGLGTTILLQGETGSGKGLLAHEIARGEGSPFVTINCADLTETILESELFGHAKNAFTGAGAAKKGLFDVADGGTVFIDEIDKTGQRFQEKLLRVVDRREFKPVGSLDLRHVKCRIVCASNRDLRQEVEEKRFLQDLYYRLKVISIRVPPLRERPEDIVLLAEHFLANYSRAMGKEVRFADEALRLFTRYPWPGNVRDLQNEVERAVALASNGETVRIAGLSDELVSFAKSGLVARAAGERSLAGMVEELEERVIREALLQLGGNKSRAAERLGLTRKGLRNKIVRYGIES